jgi:transposase
MLRLTPDTKVYLALGHTDMRKSISTLSILVSEQMTLDIFSGSLFVFCNRKRNIIKLIYWDRNGFCLWQKRLEKDLFKWPQTRQDVMAVGVRELAWLIQGLDINHAHKPLKYSTVY